MATIVVSEEQNKRWLAIIKGWVEQEKLIPLSILYIEEGCPILEDFKQHEEELIEYLRSLDSWLKDNGIKEALMQMPSVGFLLSHLCKLTLASLSDSVFKQLVACIYHLSDIWNFGKESEDPAAESGKKWAVDHFCTMNTVDVEGIDLFLMEEFGVSPEEYLDEHVKQSSLGFLQLLESSVINVTSAEKSLVLNVFEVLQMAYDCRIAPVFEGLLRLEDTKTFVDGELYFLSKKHVSWLLKNSELMGRFSVQTLHLIFSQNISTFEEYVIDVIEKVTETYPGFHREIIDDYISKARLKDICSQDGRYYSEIIRIIKDSFVVIGFHPGLVQLLRTFVKLVDNFRDVSNIDFQNIHSLEKILMMSPCGLDLNHKEEILRKADKVISDDIENRAIELKNEFEIWFQLAQYADWIDEAILLLFVGSRQNVAICMKLLLRFFYPTNQALLKSGLHNVVSYVYALRNLLSKNHIAFSDLEYLLLLLQKKIPPGSDLKIILMIFGMVFIAKCNGGDTIAETYVEYIFKEIRDDKSIYWFLYTIQILLGDATSLSKKVALKEALTKKLDQIQFLHGRNGDEMSCDNMEVDSVSSVRRENVFIICCKMKNDLVVLTQ